MHLPWGQLRRLLGIFVISFVGLAGALTLGGSAAAHHPVLETNTDRPCGDAAPWTATVTARSDQDYDKDWRSRHEIDGLALGEWSPLADDQVPYEFEVGPFEADVDLVTVGVESEWYLKSDASLSVSDTRTIEIERPDTWECPTSNPGAPAVTYDCVTAQPVITGTDDTDSVHYTVTVITAPDGEGSPWQIHITATPQPGYEFDDYDDQTEWTFTGTVDCLDTTNPGAPAVTYDCVTAQPVITGTDDTDSVHYTVTVITAPDGEGSPWQIHITATPQPGYEFAPDAQTDWQFTGTVDCLDTTNPGAPAVTYDCVTAQPVITGTDDTDSVHYTVTVITAPDGEGSPWQIHITATPQPGYEFAPDAQTDWQFTGTVDCLDTTNPGAPAVTYDCVTAQPVITGTDDTDSVHYTVTVITAPDGEGSPWQIHITATPQPGYEFAPDAQTDWQFTGTVDCLVAARPDTPQLTCRLAPDKGLALQLTPSETYTYEVSGNLDVNENDIYDVRVTAVPEAGFEFEAGAVTTWSFTGVVECQRSEPPPPPPTLPRTGSTSTGLLLAYASMMTLAGGFLMLVKRSFRPR